MRLHIGMCHPFRFSPPYVHVNIYDNNSNNTDYMS